MAETKFKGNIAETQILAALVKMGFTVSIPYGEDTRYDLVVDTGKRLLRLQCKYTTSTKGFVFIKACSSNNWQMIKYTIDSVDIIAVYESISELIYYVPLSEFSDTQYSMQLRLNSAKNNQIKRIRQANLFLDFPNALLV